MALLNLIYSYVTGSLKGFFSLLNGLNEDVIAVWAEQLKLGRTLALILCAVIALVLGFLAYKYIKLFVSVGTAVMGFFLGRRLFEAVRADWMWDWMIWVFAALCALVLFALALRRSTYVCYTAMLLLGYCLVRFYLVDQFWVALGGALLLALVTVSYFRTMFILTSSFTCGILTCSFLFALLPDVKILEYQLFVLESGNLIFWLLALVLTLVFATVQFLINRRHRKA